MKILGHDHYVDDKHIVFDAESFINRQCTYVAAFIKYSEIHGKYTIAEYTASLGEILKPHVVGVVLPEDFQFDIVKTYSRLVENPELTRLVLSFLGARLHGIFLGQAYGDSISTRDWLTTWLHLRFHMAKAVEPLLGRVSALEFVKNFVDFCTISISDELRKESVAEFVKPLSGALENSFDAVRFELEGQDRVGVCITRCRWAESLQGLNDPEFAYVVACHYDFVAARAANPHFRLTRTKTCLQGGGFCDFVWHDMRVCKTQFHPKAEFWDECRSSIQKNRKNLD